MHFLTKRFSTTVELSNQLVKWWFFTLNRFQKYVRSIQWPIPKNCRFLVEIDRFRTDLGPEVVQMIYKMTFGRLVQSDNAFTTKEILISQKLAVKTVKLQRNVLLIISTLLAVHGYLNPNFKIQTNSAVHWSLHPNFQIRTNLTVHGSLNPNFRIQTNLAVHGSSYPNFKIQTNLSVLGSLHLNF